jgi:hypothetical protein
MRRPLKTFTEIFETVHGFLYFCSGEALIKYSSIARQQPYVPKTKTAIFDGIS